MYEVNQEAQQYRDALETQLRAKATLGSTRFQQWLFDPADFRHAADFEASNEPWRISAMAKDAIEQAVACQPDVMKALALILKVHGW